MAHKYSSPSRQGIDARRSNRRKVRSLKAGNLSSPVDVRAIEERINGYVSSARMNAAIADRPITYVSQRPTRKGL